MESGIVDSNELGPTNPQLIAILQKFGGGNGANLVKFQLVDAICDAITGQHVE